MSSTNCNNLLSTAWSNTNFSSILFLLINIYEKFFAKLNKLRKFFSKAHQAKSKS